VTNISLFKNKRANQHKDERGFTLIEVSISLVIMMVVGLGAASLFAYATKNNSAANDRELAMAVAQKRLEWLRNMPFNVQTRNLAFSYPDGGLAATALGGVTETIVSGGRTYIVTTVIQDTETVPAGDPDANQPTVKTITITVTATGTATAMGSVTLVTQRSTLVPGIY
jgi:prepilin-type N-terminal cleavage/methylation domain-containing protein